MLPWSGTPRRLPNPVPVTDENLIAGMKLYSMNCAVCHGALNYSPSLLEHSMYPPPPQIILDPLDDPGMAYPLRHPHRRSLHRNAGVEQGARR